MKKHIYRLIFAMLTLFTVMKSEAVCLVPVSNNLLLAHMLRQPVNITVQRDLPVGAIIGTYTSPNYSEIIARCDNTPGTITFRLYSGSSTNIPDVYSTNVQGVGYSLEAPNYASGTMASPAGTVFRTSTAQTIRGDSMTLRLVKTGNIVPGIITSIYNVGEINVDSGMVPAWPGGAGLIFNNGYRLHLYALHYPHILQTACSISTPNIQVPLDDVLASDLTSPGTTAKPKTFNVGLNCDAGARINAKLTGTKNTDTTTNGVLQVTGAGTTGVADGVGIQLLYNSAPLELDKNIVLKTSAGGQETFPFTARYYQTRPSVTVGTANATATLEMTYQ